jgi:hypothetical protein
VLTEQQLQVVQQGQPDQPDWMEEMGVMAEMVLMEQLAQQVRPDPQVWALLVQLVQLAKMVL